jgi:hypothetical protein
LAVASWPVSVLRSESGQASVEFVAIVPFVILAALLAWQIALAGETLWLCAHAARAGARAAAVGRDAERAARSVLPSDLEGGLRVSRADGGAVRVELRVPLILHQWRTPVAVAASAGLPRGGS